MEVIRNEMSNLKILKKKMDELFTLVKSQCIFSLVYHVMYHDADVVHLQRLEKRL